MAECDINLDVIIYGDMVNSAIQEVKVACDRDRPVIAINIDGYELQLQGVKRLIHNAIASLKNWK